MGRAKTKWLWQAIKVLWLIACVSVLVLTLLYHGPKWRDAVIAEVILMTTLSFPIGYVVAYLTFGTLIGGNKATELQEILSYWSVLFVVGYLQWFVLVPALVRWLRKKFGNNSPSDISVVPKD